MPFYSTKTYGPERGLSCAYRQWDAGTDCQLLHGYALGFRFVFAAEQLDRRGWVVDFGDGGFGKIRRWLHKMFDHTLLVAVDDPARDVFESLAAAGSSTSAGASPVGLMSVNAASAADSAEAAALSALSALATAVASDAAADSAVVLTA